MSALADGQLGPAESERALAHTAGCPACAAQLTAARQARRALSVVADVEPAADLTARLLALAAGPPSATAGPGSDAPGEPGSGRRAPIVPLGSSAYSVPAGALTGDLTRRRVPWFRVAAVSVATLAVVGVTLFQLGARPAVVPSAHAAQALAMLGADGPGGTGSATWAPGLAAQINAVSASSSSGSPASADAAVLGWMDVAGWTCPAALPDGYVVTAARLVGDSGAVLELDLATPDGRTVVTEQHGRLQVAALAAPARLTVGDRTVYVLTRQPWHAVWQSGDTVVSIVARAYTPNAAELVAGFPAVGYDDGFSARLTRGWDTVTGAFARP